MHLQLLHPCLHLPNSSSERYLDRFSILDESYQDEDGLVQLWPILTHVLASSVSTPRQLIDCLETLANTIHGTSQVAGNYGTLLSAVNECENFFSDVWPEVVASARETPQLFVSGRLEALVPGKTVRLSRRQAKCLVAHQVLGTLRPSEWRKEYFSFAIWYDSSQRHEPAVRMYLAALFSYFGGFDKRAAHSAHCQEVTYALLSSTHAAKSDDCQDLQLSQATIVRVHSYSTEQQERTHQGASGGVVVSANKVIGFGQSATQEELYVGNCPEACPAVLFTPVLDKDHVLVIEGACPMLRIYGQRRDIQWEYLQPRDQIGGRMLFMDALEIDELDGDEGLPDLHPQNLQREITKAVVAFGSWSSRCHDDPDHDGVVWTGLWGCGAFNGDPAVKMLALWIAASRTNKRLNILCDPAQEEFASRFELLIHKVQPAFSPDDLLDLLGRVPGDMERLQTINWLLAN